MTSFRSIRQPKMTTQALLNLDLAESSSDSDFCIDDYDSDNSKDDDGDDKTTSSSSSDSPEDKDESNIDSESAMSALQVNQLQVTERRSNMAENNQHVTNDLKSLIVNFDQKSKVFVKTVCCVCLGDRSDDSNEIVECDGCGVSVHEGCYGVSDNSSISSTNSTCSTEPWFCEACRAGVSDPICELCPNKGGIYKETDVGKWVHLVCALYVPGVAFGEVDQLSSVTLFEMQYNKWGAKACLLCPDPMFARTGVCIGCDAGMCKNYFHVTCAQAAGFLTEARNEDTDIADPFYAHCKQHTDKELVKKRQRNFYSLRLYMEQRDIERTEMKLEDSTCPAQIRIQRKLLKYQSKYVAHKQSRPNPWVPTQKMSRLLNTSASACRRLMAKAKIMDVDVDILERQQSQICALTDIRKKWHIAPAFSVEFIAYYVDRISRVNELKQELTKMFEQNSSYSKEQDTLRNNYDVQLEKNRNLKMRNEALAKTINEFHQQVSVLCPTKSLPNTTHICNPESVVEILHTSLPPSRPISVPTAAALKMGVGFPLAHLGPPGSKVDSSLLLSTHIQNSSSYCPTKLTTLNEAAINFSNASFGFPVNNNTTVTTFVCGICNKSTDQHLLVKCDTCELHYHLACLNPPLTRHPKKSKLYGWQCSECDKSDESDRIAEIPKGRRKPRTRFNKDGSIMPKDCLPLFNEIQTNSKQYHESVSVVPIYESSIEKPFLIVPPSNMGNEHNSSRHRTSIKTSKQNLSGVNNSPESPKKELQIEPSLNLSSPYPKKNGINNRDPAVVPETENTKDLAIIVEKEQASSNMLSASYPIRDCIIDVASNDLMISNELPINNNTLTNDKNIFDVSIPSEEYTSSKQSRKQKRKEKHKNKYNQSGSDSGKSPNKEHKRKRKKKHDTEDSLTDVPKIKIKFKTLPLPGEITPEAQFFYVPADTVCSAGEASRPTSVETIAETPPPTMTITSVATSTLTVPTIINIPQLSTTPTKQYSTSKNVPSPRKISPRKTTTQRTSTVGRPHKYPANHLQKILACCVCQANGTPTNVVTCDECRRHYHFTCLEPPLKKSPKIRGYSWHCADCDPTEDEKL